jgi:hypothetical protein
MPGTSCCRLLHGLRGYALRRYGCWRADGRAQTFSSCGTRRAGHRSQNAYDESHARYPSYSGISTGPADTGARAWKYLEVRDWVAEVGDVCAGREELIKYHCDCFLPCRHQIRVISANQSLRIRTNTTDPHLTLNLRSKIAKCSTRSR